MVTTITVQNALRHLHTHLTPSLQQIDRKIGSKRFGSHRNRQVGATKHDDERSKVKICMYIKLQKPLDVFAVRNLNK